MSILRTFSIFAKYWEKGKVKTRLAKSIGDADAAQIYLKMLEVSLDLVRNWSGRKVLGYSPTDKVTEFKKLAPDFELIPQLDKKEGKPADLGVRIQSFFDAAFHSCDQPQNVVLIGSDCPLISADCIASAFEHLESNDVVIGPSQDGGYYLIGARHKTPNLFEKINWSTDQVLQQTILQLDQQGYRYHQLDPLSDVDDLDDLLELIDNLRNCESLSFSQQSLLNVASRLVNKNDKGATELILDSTIGPDSESTREKR